MAGVDLLGWMAAALTLLTFAMRSMVCLRLVALTANVCFIGYGLLELLVPVIVLHVLLIPCNLWRLVECVNDGRADRFRRANR